MEIALLTARLLLAAMFAVAGLAKLWDPAGSRQALIGFGLPAALATPLGRLLPLAELAVAVALVPTISAWWGALGALALLLVFVAGIGYNLARGRRPECHCFGQLHSAPAGWSTLIRNLLLTAVAGFVVGLGRTTAGLSVLDWLGSLTLTQSLELLGSVLVVALLAFESWGLFQVLQQQGRLLLRLEAVEAQLAANGTPSLLAPAASQSTALAGLPVGSAAPPFELADLNGARYSLAALCALRKPVLLLFSDPDCGPCTALLPEIGHWQRDHAPKVVVVLISRGTVEAHRPKATEYGMTHVLLQKDREVAQAYQASGTPCAVLVRPDGTIGSPPARGADAIRALIATTLNPAALNTLPMAAAANGNEKRAITALRPPAGPKMGDPAPDFSLPDLSGYTVHLAEFRGNTTLLLFWRPSCGFCQRMLPDLKAWEANPPTGAPQLLVISTGSAQDNQALGLRSPILLDKDGISVGTMFGATGTPMAVLVDKEGKTASELAVGAQAVLALAGVGQDQISAR